MTHPTMSDLPQYPPQPTYSNVPIPDPSLITEREIAKAKTDIRREFELQLIGARDVLTAQLDGRAARRSRSVKRMANDNKDAIAAALRAQKEETNTKHDANAATAVKMETYFAKQADQTQQLLHEMQRSTDGKINDLKSRLDKGEGTLRGGAETRTEHRLNVGSVMGIIGGVVGLLALLWSVSQAIQVGNNQRQISALQRDSTVVPPGYTLVPTLQPR